MGDALADNVKKVLEGVNITVDVVIPVWRLFFALMDLPYPTR